MSTGQDRSPEPQTGAQAGQDAHGASGTGMTGAAGRTGPGSTRPTTTGSTATGTAEPSGSQISGERRYEEGGEPGLSYGPEAYQTSRGGVMGGSLAVLAGLMSFLGGLAVVVRPRYYPTLSGYAYAWNGRGWGWILLILGVLLFAAGASALLGISAARPVGVGIAVLTAIAGFLFLVYAPVWGIVIVGLSVFAIWGLLRDSERSEAM